MWNSLQSIADDLVGGCREDTVARGGGLDDVRGGLGLFLKRSVERWGAYDSGGVPAGTGCPPGSASHFFFYLTCSLPLRLPAFLRQEMGCGSSKPENDRDSSVMAAHGDVADEVNMRVCLCYFGKKRFLFFGRETGDIVALKLSIVQNSELGH